MKKLILSLVLVFSALSGYGQIIRVPVGEEKTLIDSISYLKYYYVYCGSSATTDTCRFSFAVVSHIENGKPKNYPSAPFFWRSNYQRNSNSLYFLSNKAGEFIDTFSLIYTWTQSAPKCFDACRNNPSEKKNYHIIAYYDGAIKIRNSEQFYLLFMPDSINKHYYDASFLKVEIYNNRSDTVKCDRWSFKTDSITKSSFEILGTDSTVLDSIILPPYSYTTLFLHVRSDANIFDTLTAIPCAFTAHISNTTTDSIVALNLDSYFFPVKKNSVFSHGMGNIELIVYPNPTSLTSNFICRTLELGKFDMQIFDELGKEVRTIYNGFLDAGEHEFSAKLPSGIYYVRMQTGAEVLTRKVIVSK